MLTFGQKLKQLREAAGLTQFEFAAKVKIARTTLARLETDVAVPSWPVVATMAKVLKVSCEEFPAMERSKGPKPAKPKKPPRRKKT